MKHRISLLIFLVATTTYAQVGQTAAQIAVDIADATLPVTTTMVAINLHQQDVLKYSKSIAEKTAAIMVLKEAELKSLKETPGSLEETSPWKRAIIYVDGIVQFNSNTTELISNYPDVEGIPIESIILITAETYDAFSDLTAIAQGGDDNLMSPAARFKLIKKANSYLKKLYDLSNKLNQLTRILILFSGEVVTDTTYDTSEAMDSILEEIENFVIE